MTLYFSQHTSALILCGAPPDNHSTESERNSIYDFENDAQKICNSLVHGTNLMQKSQVQLMKPSHSCCCKEGVIEAMRKQAKIASAEDGLFVFVYTGGASDIRDFGLGFTFRDSNAFVDICPMGAQKRHILKLTNSQPVSTHSVLSGDIIGRAIQREKPHQLIVILDCPFAKEIGADLRECLSDCSYVEITVPRDKERIPCYYETLKSSAFAYFLDLIAKNTKFVEGQLPIKSILVRVEKCCEALSSLEMIREGEWIRKKVIVPRYKLLKIPFIPHGTCNGSGSVSSDEVDGQLRFLSLVERHYPWNPNWKTAKLCTEAVDWVQAVTHICLRALKSEDVLEDDVLKAVVGTMVFSIATIQIGLKQKVTFPSLFLQGFMLAVAAVDLIDPGNAGLSEDSMITTALHYYQHAVN